MNSPTRLLFHCSLFALLAQLYSCANVGSPDGGPYDETPPHLVQTWPKEYATHATSTRLQLLFDEVVRLNNPYEKIIISPPQLEQPEIRTSGRRIVITLKDTLKSNCTYSLDFGDAIEDNTAGNAIDNYAFVFSTGENIDTLQVSGTVLEASNLEPIKGILVGLHSDTSDSAFCKKPLERISRTDGRGRFTIKGIAPGKYRIFALEDAESDFIFMQKSEKIAFQKEIIIPSSTPAFRNDTIWSDSTHVDSIIPVSYTRYLPDDIVLRAFEEEDNTCHLLKTERKRAQCFTLYFTAPMDSLPRIRGLNFNSENAFLTTRSLRGDTLTYWLNDTALVRQDTLEMEMSYYETNDSTGILSLSTDTLEIISKTPYARIEKNFQEKLNDWIKLREKAQKKGSTFTKPRPRDWLKARYSSRRSFSPSDNLSFLFDEPVAHIDSSLIRLELRRDSLYESRPYLFVQDTLNPLRFTLIGEWRPGQAYRLIIDSAAVTSIYDHHNMAIRLSFNIPALDTYASLFVNVKGLEGENIRVQLLSPTDNVQREISAKDGRADFFFLRSGEYFMRLYVDRNRNNRWDTGDYASGLQPEEMYYYPEPLRLRSNWDIEQEWDVLSTPVVKQKPERITKQKPDRAKVIRQRNAERERKKAKRR